MLVTVDDLPVVCHNMTCDYTYVKPIGEITGATYDKSTRKLIITGVDLPGLLLPGANGTNSTGSNSTSNNLGGANVTNTTGSNSTSDNSGGRRLLKDLR